MKKKNISVDDYTTFCIVIAGILALILTLLFIIIGEIHQLSVDPNICYFKNLKPFVGLIK